MPKGVFTQTVCVLLKQAGSLQELERALGSFAVQGSHAAAGDWEFAGPSITIDFRPEVNGRVVVDLVDRSWPDDMGDPKKSPSLFGAWGMGQFGPFTFPGGLERASGQCWAWEPGKTIAKRHKGFVRIRASYVLGSGEDAPVMPEDYDPVAELKFVTEVAVAALEMPEAICYFNPNGELLRDKDSLVESLGNAEAANLLPLDIWSNIRLFNVGDGWSLMDTVGNGQLDLPDIEACFSQGYDCGDVDRFLRNISWYLLQKGEVIQDEDTMDGPGGVAWQARQYENGLTQPPRRVLSWLPLDDTEVPENILTR